MVVRYVVGRYGIVAMACLFWRYCHLSGIAFAAGKPVSQKQLIGWVGQTGLATGPHLHYGVKRGGPFMNPLQLPGAAREADPAGVDGGLPREGLGRGPPRGRDRADVTTLRISAIVNAEIGAS